MFRILISLMALVLSIQPPLIGDEKVIIAVASEEDTLESAVSHTAARCPFYIIVDGEGKILEAVENPYKDTRGGAGVSAAEFLAGKNVTTLIAGNVGNKMKEELDAQEIAYLEFEGTVEEAIKKTLAEES